MKQYSFILEAGPVMPHVRASASHAGRAVYNAAGNAKNFVKNKWNGGYGSTMGLFAGLGALYNGIKGYKQGKGFIPSAIGGAVKWGAAGAAAKWAGNRMGI